MRMKSDRGTGGRYEGRPWWGKSGGFKGGWMSRIAEQVRKKVCYSD